MQTIDITPKWYTSSADDVGREARRETLRNVTTHWYSEQSKFGEGHRCHFAAGMRLDIGDDRVAASAPDTLPSFMAFCNAMRDRLSAEKVQQLAAGRARLMRGEGVRVECTVIGGSGPESNLPATEITDPITGQFVVEVRSGEHSHKFWSSHAGI